MSTFNRVLAAWAVAFLPWSSFAYNEAGHFYTAYALARTLKPGDSQQRQLLVAFCAQLPDMADDLDAVSVYGKVIVHSPLDWARWAASNDTSAPEVARMVTIQQVLHALTGGNARAVQDVADRALTDLHQQAKSNAPAALCALGFALHFKGDSFAHERMDDIDLAPAARRMYSTGQGHAVHRKYPDYVLCTRLNAPPRILRHCKDFADADRFAAWKQQLWAKASTVYDPPDSGIDSPEPRLKYLAAVTALGPGASDFNDWNEEQMETALSDEQAHDVSQFILKQHSSRSCESVLGDALSNVGVLQRFSGLKCADVWNLYRAAMIKAYAAAPENARTPLDRPLEQIYQVDVLD